MKRPIMTITMQNQHVIQIELFPDITPNTVHSIIHIAKQGKYNGRAFYRIVKDFVLQTGCELTADNPDGCDYILDGEYRNSGYDAEQPSFTKGIVGMAGLGGTSNVSDGSSFFIMTGDSAGLDGSFAVVGKVIEGMDEVDRLNEVPVVEKFYGKIPIHMPAEPEIMQSVVVETFGVEYPAPRTKPFNDRYKEMERELERIRTD